MKLLKHENVESFKLVLKAFSDAAYRNFNNNHSFQAGYLQSLSTQMFEHLPRKYQEIFLEDMVRATRKQEKQLVEKILQGNTSV